MDFWTVALVVVVAVCCSVITGVFAYNHGHAMGRIEEAKRARFYPLGDKGSF